MHWTNAVGSLTKATALLVLAALHSAGCVAPPRSAPDVPAPAPLRCPAGQTVVCTGGSASPITKIGGKRRCRCRDVGISGLRERDTP